MKARSEYYEVPAQWAAPHLLSTYARLTKSFHVAAPRNLEAKVAHPLIQSRHALHQLSLGIKADDQACIWLSAEFVASASYFCGSGYLKATMARRLKQASLDEQTAEVIRRGVLNLWSHGGYRQEWREYYGLLAHIGVDRYKKQFSALIESSHPGTRRYIRQLVAVQNAT